MASDPRITLSRDVGPRLSTVCIKYPSVFLRRAGRPSAPTETQLLFGDCFHVHDASSAWYFGQAVSPVKTNPTKGYVGWIPKRATTQIVGRVIAVITVLGAPVFKAPDIKSGAKMTLPLNAQLRGRHTGDFLALNSGGYVHTHHFATAPIATDFVAVAEAHLGQPYVWAGVASNGLDCSGLVQSALRAVGRDCPRDADQQEAALGEHIPAKQTGLKRGDLVFWPGHVGIMASAKRLLHANAFHMSVAKEPLNTAAHRIAKSSGPIRSIKRLF